MRILPLGPPSGSVRHPPRRRARAPGGPRPKVSLPASLSCPEPKAEKPGRHARHRLQRQLGRRAHDRPGRDPEADARAANRRRNHHLPGQVADLPGSWTRDCAWAGGRRLPATCCPGQTGLPTLRTPGHARRWECSVDRPEAASHLGSRVHLRGLKDREAREGCRCQRLRSCRCPWAGHWSGHGEASPVAAPRPLLWRVTWMLHWQHVALPSPNA